jgi:hypothetical protein
MKELPMRRTQHSVLIAFAIALCTAAGSQAAVISVQPVIVGFFDTSFNQVAPPLPVPGGGTTNTGFPTIIQVDVYMEVLSLAPGEDSFGTAAFSFQAAAVFSHTRATIVPDIDAGGWAAAAHGNTDSNGAVPGGVVPLIATNGDLGIDSQDYQGILVQMATGAFTNAADQRRNVGEPGSSFGVPLLLGSAFYEWSGVAGVSITLDPVEVSAKLTNGTFVAGQAPPSAILYLGNPNVPEPSSLFLMVVGAFGVIARRR